MSPARLLFPASLLALMVISIAIGGTAGAQDADDAAPQLTAAPEIELVEVFTETRQALVYDAHEREYVLLRKGTGLRDFEVADISSSQLEMFRPANPARRYVMRKPTPLLARLGTALDAPDRTAAVRTDGPLDPYSTPKAPPIEPPEPIKTVVAPVASQPLARPSRSIVTRTELDKALDDLETLSRELDLELVPGGVRVASIGQGSLPFRLGLRKDDIVHRVAGVPTTRLEDGADVFVKLARVRSFSIDIERGGRKLQLPVAVISQ